jgi:hypothetical protein
MGEYIEVELCDEGSVIYVHCMDLVLTETERRLYVCWVLGVYS